ncbi:MAG: LuxR C-terminal-related transcriptional regulator [Acidobacteriota bacterium]
MIRVALAQEHRILRWALREALGRAGDFEVVGEAGTVDDTLAMIRRDRPEVLVIDTSMPDHTPFDVLGKIREIEAGPFVVVLAPHDEAAYAARAVTAGAHAYVSATSPPELLLEAIRAVTRGEQIVPPAAEPLLAAGEKGPNTLTARELQVMEMLARGMTSREIADHFDLSIKTVDTHRAHLLKKLRVRNNAELARFAVKHGYVTL